MKSKIITLIFITCLLIGCGYSQRDSDLVGQVKKVTNETPILCPDYIEADISLGIMRNGIGSMSKEDVSVLIPNNTEMIKVFKDATVNGKLIKVIYDEKRFAFCTCMKIAKSVSYID